MALAIGPYKVAAQLLLDTIDGSVELVQRSESHGCTAAMDVLMAELRGYLQDEGIIKDIAEDHEKGIVAYWA